MVIEIEKAMYLGGYEIQLNFSDNTEQIINFEEFLTSSKNPMTLKFLDKNTFQKFTNQYGDIIWNDYEMCFPIWDLHEGIV